MIFGPVLPVELVTSSRRVRYFIVRVVYAAILLVTLWTQYESSMAWRVNSGNPLSASELADFAEEFSQSFAIVQLLAVLVLTPALVAGTVAEEKERKTIEYLFVTDLRDQEIVLGKLAARMLHLAVLVAVGWPVLAMLMLLGGVAMESVLAIFAITASTAFVVAALSIWSSVQARRGRDAVMRVFVIGLALLILPPIASAFSWFGWRGWGVVQAIEEAIVDELMAANPFVCLASAMGQAGTDWNAGELRRPHRPDSSIPARAGSASAPARSGRTGGSGRISRDRGCSRQTSITVITDRTWCVIGRIDALGSFSTFLSEPRTQRTGVSGLHALSLTPLADLLRARRGRLRNACRGRSDSAIIRVFDFPHPRSSGESIARWSDLCSRGDCRPQAGASLHRASGL